MSVRQLELAEKGRLVVKRILVIGDQFARAIDRPDVFSMSGFLAQLQSGHYDDPHEKIEVWFGQCVDRSCQEEIERALHRRGLTQWVTVASRHTLPVHRSQVHKQRQENVLLGDVVRVEQNRFHACLTIHEKNELILDHVSGQHISGMLINEAVRQMALAVTEMFYAADRPGLKYLLHSWTTTFERLLFPVDALLIYTVDDLDARRADRLRFRMSVDIVQHGRRAARSSMEFSTAPESAFGRLEKRTANELLDEILEPHILDVL